MSDSDPLPCSPPADLPPDILLEIFLHLSSEPRHLLAASLVCKRWRRLVRNPDFLRRFRAFHRAPPVLGFFQNIWCVTRCSNQHQRRLGFKPTVSSVGRLTPPNPDLMRWALDCRHGRVLLQCSGDQGLHVWDPMAGEAHYLRRPPGSQGLDIAAAVVCAAGHDDHTDCHSTPFQIVFLDACKRVEDDGDVARILSAYVYSSETDAWGDATVITFPFTFDSSKGSVLVGNSLYWMLELDELFSSYILEFSLSGQRLELIELPDADVCEAYMSDIHVMPAEDGGIGFVGVNQSSLHFWSRRIDPEGAAEWVLIRIVDLNKLSGLPAADILLFSSVVACSEDGDELFIQSEAGIFMINIRSLRLKKVLEATGLPIYPYTSFYTREHQRIEERRSEVHFVGVFCDAGVTYLHRRTIHW
ncbi:hypothetical protein EJB05_22945 [Eragrostis curvula]|uniref:F-box domain-containing protein n=1 Tax=Eragrostis curvula TaxID=38414 RepID=A0A5J9V6Y0_9POAL|nr:hypothetical protein EJB05_22945 [Eragrostis curvula]